MENKPVKEYTKLEQYQYVQQHYGDNLRQINLIRKLAEELKIPISRSYAIIQTSLHVKGLHCSISHILKKELNIAKMVFMNRTEPKQEQQNSVNIPENKPLPMFNQNVGSLSKTITELIMKQCPFLDNEKVLKRIESLVSYIVTSKTTTPQLLFENLEIVLLAAFYKTSLFHDGEEAKFYLVFGKYNENKGFEVFFNAVWTEKGVRKSGLKSFFQIETNESMITKIVAFLQAKPDKIHEVVNMLK